MSKSKRTLHPGLFRALWCTLVCLSTLLPATSAVAQGSRRDYERADSYADRTRNRVFRSQVQPRWLEGSPQFWYRVDIGPQQHEFILVDAQEGTRRRAFDHERLAEALTEASGEKVQPNQLPLRSVSFDEQVSAVRFAAFGKQWEWHLESKKLSEFSQEKSADAEEMGVFSLDSVRRSRRTGEETSVCFVNRTEVEVKLFWIDSSGDRKLYETIAAGQEHDQHTYEGHVWLATETDGRALAAFEATAQKGVALIDGSRRPTPARGRGWRRGTRTNDTSPDGCWRAFIRNNNLLVEDLRCDEEFALSSNGTDDDPYEPPFHWSPDSRKLVVPQVRKGDQREIHLIQSSPKDQVQPKLQTVEYSKPGDRMPVPRPRLFDLESRSQIDVLEEQFENAWSISEVRWLPDSQHFTFLYNQRGHQVLRIVEVDANCGAARVVVGEESTTFIDYAFKSFTHYLDETNEIIWMSQRDGWNHLYLYHARLGDVKNQITRGRWVVRGVQRVDEEKRQIWFRAGGVYPEQDPYYVHLCRVNFDGSGFLALTQGDGNHRWTFSPDRCFFIDSYSRVDQPTVTELRDSKDGSLVCELERADWQQLLSTGWRPPERFVAKGRDGNTDIYGVIVRPTNFDCSRKYPVIEKIYAGPQSAYVPKSFGLLNDLYATAELGFIVVQIDGMGTSHRSKAFHDVCWKNLGDSGFPDRIAWMKAAAAANPEMDLTRVGIYGGSAGGQSALRGLLMHGDFYKAAAADCGCHDNRMDKIWWNELWMGWPVGPHYEEQSNVTQAHRLQGRLLLTVGELDRNVDPASTLQVVDALIKADKDFEMLVVPGAGHGVGERPYAKRRRADFFVRHLLQVKPRWAPADVVGPTPAQ